MLSSHGVPTQPQATSPRRNEEAQITKEHKAPFFILRWTELKTTSNLNFFPKLKMKTCEKKFFTQ